MIPASKRILSSVVLAMVGASCGPDDLPESSYFDERIQPVLATSCVRQNNGCHLTGPNGASAGNLDLSSYDAAMRRRDLFEAYGPYPLPLLLLKPGDPVMVSVETFDPPDPVQPDVRATSIRTRIRHVGGSTVDLGTSGFALLQQWTASGHLRTGVPDETLRESVGACSTSIGSTHGYDRALADSSPSLFARFSEEVNPVLRDTCAGGSCHGNSIADLYLTCGDDDEQLRWNYWIALQFMTSPSSTSELLRRPLSKRRGGTFHEGGSIFGSVDDPRYEILRAFAETVATEAPQLLAPWVPPEADEEGYRFYANRVQPVLVRDGCMFMNCHSPSMFHDLRLRGGAGGHFGRVATAHNYRLARDMLAVDATSVNEARIVAKNLYPPQQIEGGKGLHHRGGSLFEVFGLEGDRPNLADLSDCASVDATNGDLNEVPAYCVIAEWHRIERENAIARGEIFAEGVRSILWVERPVGVGTADDFDTYRPGADLRRASVTVGSDGSISLGPSSSMLGGCSLSVASADIRGPAVRWDGERIAFAARTGANSPLRLYEMSEDGSGCAPISGVDAGAPSANGILIHDFDPAYAPDGRLVFASTRGNLSAEINGRTGPTRAPSSMRPNANLYIREDGGVRQLTFLLNQELQPSFMLDGRILCTAEKRELEFHQMSGRRINVEGGDHHPLFAQRDSVGFRSATEIVESLDRNFVMVAAPIDAADGAGALLTVNRSLGPDQTDRDPADRAYLHSMFMPVPSVLSGGTGVFRSPAPLPNGRWIASCDLGATDLTSGGYDYQLCEIDPDAGTVRALGGAPGRADVEVVAVFARPPHPVFTARPDEPNGRTIVEPGQSDARIFVNDFPLLATLLFSNTRTGRPIDPRIGGFEVLESLPPPEGATDFAGLDDVETDTFGMFYRSLRTLGHVPLHADGSAVFQIRGGAPIQLVPTDRQGRRLSFEEGALFTGEMIQREQMQFAPGERAFQSMPRPFFNGLCGGCHGSISNRELDTAADIDVLTSASRYPQAVGDAPVDLR